MKPPKARIDFSDSSLLPYCECGWRELALTRREARERIAIHLAVAHGASASKARGALYAAKKRDRLKEER